MRISDWSSDVCSSDLGRRAGGERKVRLARGRRADQVQPVAGTPGRQRLDLRQRSRWRGNEAVQSLVGRIAQRQRQLRGRRGRSEEHTSELQSLMRISYAVFCLKKKKRQTRQIIM